MLKLISWSDRDETWETVRSDEATREKLIEKLTILRRHSICAYAFLALVLIIAVLAISATVPTRRITVDAVILLGCVSILEIWLNTYVLFFFALYHICDSRVKFLKALRSGVIQSANTAVE